MHTGWPDGPDELMRRAAKIDANQPEIVEALRAIGCQVQPIHTVGHGCPDLLVGAFGRTLMMEVKDGSKPPSARQLTPDQQEWHSKWTGGPLCIVDSIEAAIRAVNAVRAD